MSTKHIGIAVVGLPAAGKSTFIGMARDLGFACIEWSDVVARDFAIVPTSREETYAAAAELVRVKGVSHYPTVIYRILSGTQSFGHLVSGARNPTELAYLKTLYGFFRVAWISSTYAARFRRSAHRDGIHRSEHIEQFVRNDLYELRGGLLEVACDHADDILFNDGTLDDYRSRVTYYLEQILAKGRTYNG